MAKSDELIEEVLVNQLESIKNGSVSEADMSSAIGDALDLAKAKNEIELRKESVKARKEENESKKKEFRWKIVLDGAKLVFDIGAAVASGIIYNLWMNRGLKFEEEGTYTSTTYREHRNNHGKILK